MYLCRILVYGRSGEGLCRMKPWILRMHRVEGLGGLIFILMLISASLKKPSDWLSKYLP